MRGDSGLSSSGVVGQRNRMVITLSHIESLVASKCQPASNGKDLQHISNLSILLRIAEDHDLLGRRLSRLDGPSGSEDSFLTFRELILLTKG